MMINIGGRIINPDKIVKIRSLYIWLEDKETIRVDNVTSDEEIGEMINDAIVDTAKRYKLKSFVQEL